MVVELLIGRSSDKITVQPVCRDTQAMVAVGRHLVLTCTNRLDPVEAHQSTDTALTNIEACLFELHRHARATIAAKAQAVLFLDLGQYLHVCALALADWS